MKESRFRLALVLLSLLLLVAAYVLIATLRTVPVYSYVKNEPRGWVGQPHQRDAEQGAVPVPGGLGAETIPYGADVPARFDRDGFRIPLQDAAPPGRGPRILLLGDSFTYGAATPAEATFSALLGRELGGRTLNAGVCGHGLAQMLLRARRLIPQHRPDIVVVQYSPWLVQRSLSPFGPSYFGLSPAPYFTGHVPLQVQPPLYQTLLTELPFERYRYSPAGAVDFLSFAWHVGLPLLAHDDWIRLSYFVRDKTGNLPPPSTDAAAVVYQVYDEMQKLARQNGAHLVILVLAGDAGPVDIPRALFPPGALVVDAQTPLREALPVPDFAHWSQHYMHWRGTPPRLVDEHPNERAHALIATTLVREIRVASARVARKRGAP